MFSIKTQVPGASCKWGLTAAVLTLLVALGANHTLSHTAYSQSFRFMDEAGNIYFVDRLEDVPPKYRNQVLKPTPTPDPKLKKKRPPAKKVSKKKPKAKKAGLHAKVAPLTISGSRTPVAPTAPPEAPKKEG